uniref:non-specific serine/threonine protein kinase n=1 Tax=Phasianus colchicus TaxID=9054 RepID=A0A669PTR1_PHACC
MGQALCVCSRGTVSLGGARYLLLQRLAEGGFSYVDLVEGLRDGRFYALKRILCHDKEDRQAALREVEMHNLFQHPNILRLEAHCLVEKGAKHEAWLLLPYVKGGTLWSEVEALREKGSFMPEQRILLILHGICSGLQAIHSKGYAHRDLKPTNVLLDEDDQPILMDLGSMNRARMEVTNSREAMAVQDWAAQRCTISYRAPELFTVPSQCVIDERTDIWVLGCLAPLALLHDDSEPPGAAQHRGHPTAAGGAAGYASRPGHHEYLSVAHCWPRLYRAALGLLPPRAAPEGISAPRGELLRAGGVLESDFAIWRCAVQWFVP